MKTSYIHFPVNNTSWFIPNWLWVLMPDTTKARFKWHRARKLPLLLKLPNLTIHKPQFRIRLLNHGTLIHPIVGYYTSQEELTYALNLYADRRPVVEILQHDGTWSRFTPSKL